MGFVEFTSLKHFVMLKHSHQMRQECHQEEMNATEAVGIPLIHLPASLFSSPLLSWETSAA